MTIRQGGIECVKHLRGMNDGISARRRWQSIRLRPAIARRHDAQMEQAAIGHGAGGAADIARHLRAHQHNDRAFTRGRREWRPPFRAPACHRVRKARNWAISASCAAMMLSARRFISGSLPWRSTTRAMSIAPW